MILMMVFWILIIVSLALFVLWLARSSQKLRFETEGDKDKTFRQFRQGEKENGETGFFNPL